MAHFIRRRAASIQLSLAAGALGVLAGIGLGKGTAPPPQVDAELAAKKTITIYGSNIADGTIKYQDLNKASIQKGIYLKAQTDRLFLKLTDADTRFHKVITNALGGYIKLGDADTRFVKLDALNGFLKLTEADARYLQPSALDSYVKLETADGRFLKVDALNGYVKLDAADARYAKVEDLGAYVKLDAADDRYLKLGALDGYVKLDALSGYVKLTDADGRFLKLADAGALIDKHLTDYVKLDAADDRYLKLDDADARIDKHLTDNGYLKQSAADGRYLQGDGSVVTGSRLVEDSAEPLLTIDKSLGVTVEPADGDKGGAIVKLTNLGGRAQDYAGAGFDAMGAPQGGTIPPNGTVAILIGLLQPATVQIVEGDGDGTAVHTLNLTAYEIGGKLQVVGQALSGVPPAPAG